ncbi:MAG: hypothetical protein ABI806_08225 [Candidatus Solibacter sp.]
MSPPGSSLRRAASQGSTKVVRIDAASSAACVPKARMVKKQHRPYHIEDDKAKWAFTMSLWMTSAVAAGSLARNNFEPKT